MGHRRHSPVKQRALAGARRVWRVPCLNCGDRCLTLIMEPRGLNHSWSQGKSIIHGAKGPDSFMQQVTSIIHGAK